MTESNIYPVKLKKSAYITEKSYSEFYQRSLNDRDHFWSDEAEKYISWFQKWDHVMIGDFANFNVEWFVNGKLNACYNCIDRHLEKKGDHIALIWQGDEPGESLTFTFKDLHEKICRFANVLKKEGIKKGDKICVYLPMIPESLVAMLAIARIGAIHSVVFAGFSASALQTRILDADCRMVITANEGLRGNKIIPLKKNVDTALQKCPNVSKVIVVKRTDNEVPWDPTTNIWYHDALKNASDDCPCEPMDANDPFFILYTSGSTGKPKGILHSLGGYLVYVAMTHQLIFNYESGDIYWCTADIGWITGHSYLVYGPLCNAATTLMFEGVPHYPTPARFWEIIDQHQVNIFYTAPTAIRALRREGDQWVKKTKRTSLKLLGSVGEPINPDVWEWYYHTIGNGNCPIVDTWWQTETGGIMMSPLPFATPLKPGSATWPFFGIVPQIIDDKNHSVPANTMGNLIIKQPWPGMMKTVYGDHDRFKNYFPNNEYLTGDNARCDEDHYYWIAGRSDDTLKISGHRIGTEEIESGFLTHPTVSEAGIVSVPDEVKGEAIYAFVTLKEGVKPTDDLKKELINAVRQAIGAIATPKYIQWTDALPKTRSGKIMRRLLRKIANNDIDDLGDLSTVADPEVVKKLILERLQIK